MQEEFHNANPNAQIKNSITFFGRGVHYNQSTNMTVIPTGSGGVIFKRTDIDNAEIHANYINVFHTQLSTTITNGTHSVSTIEHLMAAFSYFKLKNAMILIDGPEVPLMDGGSNDFIFGLEILDIPEQHTQKLILKKEIKVELNDSYIIAKPNEKPNETFKVVCKIDFENPIIGKQVNEFNENAHNFKEKISHAKTFGHIKQIEAMNAKGICLGGDIFSAIVFNDSEIISPSYTHKKTDFVLHKILDFIGDLQISPFEIMGTFECYKSSHSLNNLLMRTIFSDENNFEIQN